jgi:hypothetical protein
MDSKSTAKIVKVEINGDLVPNKVFSGNEIAVPPLTMANTETKSGVVALRLATEGGVIKSVCDSIVFGLNILAD